MSTFQAIQNETTVKASSEVLSEQAVSDVTDEQLRKIFGGFGSGPSSTVYNGNGHTPAPPISLGGYRVP